MSYITDLPFGMMIMSLDLMTVPPELMTVAREGQPAREIDFLTVYPGSSLLSGRIWPVASVGARLL